MRISRKTLESTLAQINSTLGRPATMFANKVGEPTKFNAGHYALDKNACGWMLEEQTGDGGATIARSGRMGTADMALFLQAYLQGVMAHKCNIVSLR